MAAPTYTPQLPMVLQGLTAQNGGNNPATVASQVIENSTAVQAPGDPAPGYVDVNGVPGHPAVGQPGGNPSDVLVPDTDGNSADGASIITVASPAGTAGGGGQYPGAATNPVPNPLLTPGWTAQASTDDDIEQMVVTTASPLPPATHGDAYSETLTVTGGVGSKTWTLESGALPSPCTLSTAGVISGTPTAAGAASFEVKVVDANGNEAQKSFTVTVN